MAAWIAVLAGCTAPHLLAKGWFARAWQSDDGLPDNNIAGVVQTPDGYLWVATHGGLVCFDGARFQEFTPTAIAGVPNRVVRAMYLGRRNRLWLGMDRGPVACIDSAAAHTFTTQDGLPDLLVSVLAEDSQGSMWLAYSNRDDLLRIEEGKVTHYRQVQGVDVEGGWWLATDSDGQLWFSKGTSVGVVRQGSFQTLLRLNSGTTRITASQSGGIWICSGPRLLKFAEGAQLKELGPMAERERIEPRVLLEDRQGAVWIGTAADGLFRFDGVRFEHIQTSHREISCLTEDREGNIWAGTAGGGLNRVRPRIVELVNVESNLPFETVRSVCEDGNGAIWIVTQSGVVVRQENSAWDRITAADGWPGGHATCIAADAEGTVWIGTQERGLYAFKDGRFKAFRKRDGLGSNFVRSVLPASTGDLWIGVDSPNEVQRIRDGIIFNVEMSQPARSIRAMAEDASGRIWIGTSEGQLLYSCDGLLVSEPETSQLRPMSIRCLHATADGSLWIGYAGAGVGRLKEGRFTRITTAQGLHDNYISQIVADQRGTLWFGANRGIFHVRQEELDAACDGKADRVRSVVYGRGEGLPNLQASFDFFPGALRAGDGRLWIPMRSGLALVHPDNIRDNPDRPTVLIERSLVDGQMRAFQDSLAPLRDPTVTNAVDLRTASGGLRLKPVHRKIDFEFTALSFTAPENVHFRYKLDGVDDNWIEAGTVRNASYSRLAAGNYQFRVIACNNVGVWNPEGAALSFVVLPFFWQTWWFRAGALGAFTLSVIAIVRYVSFRRLRLEMQHLKEQAALHKERARIAKDIHDDLGASLTQIALLSELAHQDRATPQRTGEHIEKISGTARNVIKSLDEIVWAVNPRNDTLAHFIDYTGQFALDYLRVAGIRCRLDFPEKTPDHELSTDVRHNLFLVAKEAIHNVVKHAKATEAWLRVSAAESGLRMEIEDNGSGFAGESADPCADGLRNMRNRTSEAGGQCHIESRPGKGTRVTVDLPWPKE